MLPPPAMVALQAGTLRVSRVNSALVYRMS
jgi:hypothetical protein